MWLLRTVTAIAEKRPVTAGVWLLRTDHRGRTAVRAAVDAGQRPTAAGLLEAASGEQALRLVVG